MIKKITLDMLTQDSVSVKKQQYTMVDGIEYAIGQPHRKAYINSIRGREEVQNELPQAQANAIFSVWGDSPTVNEDIDI